MPARRLEAGKTWPCITSRRKTGPCARLFSTPVRTGEGQLPAEDIAEAATATFQGNAIIRRPFEPGFG